MLIIMLMLIIRLIDILEEKLQLAIVAISSEGWWPLALIGWAGWDNLSVRLNIICLQLCPVNPTHPPLPILANMLQANCVHNNIMHTSAQVQMCMNISYFALWDACNNMRHTQRMWAEFDIFLNRYVHFCKLCAMWSYTNYLDTMYVLYSVQGIMYILTPRIRDSSSSSSSSSCSETEKPG